MRNRPARRLRRLTAATGMALLAACGTGGDDDAEVLVFAAASLSDAFEEAATAFEADEPGVDVRLNLAGSAALREQVLGGAPADVFAPADPSHLAALEAEGLVGSRPVPFARNRLVLAVPEGNPASVAGLADLGRDGLLVGLCAEGVPCGDLARRALDRAGVTAAVDTAEPDVRSLLGKLVEGELDVGVVYRSDVVAAEDRVDAVDVPGGVGEVAEYRMAVLAGASDPAAAERFVAFVAGPEGRTILADHGFDAP